MDAVDLSVLIILLFSISFFGLSMALRNAKKQKSTNEVLHGSNVSVMSTALSVCSGFLSAISLLGFPAEIYYQGLMLFWYAVVYFIAFPITAYFFLPVFYDLKFTSVYEYLEVRFNFACRFLSSITFCIQILLYISVALYAPALALSLIMSIPLFISIVVTAALAALYVIAGGAKASIYTSALQMALILCTMVIIFVASLCSFGIRDVLSSAAAGGRLQLLDYRFDPRIRHSVWSLLIGGTGNILCLFATNQLTIQRYMAMKTLKSARWVVLMNIPFNVLILITYVGIGLIIFHVYSYCDPALASKDRLFPHFVVEKLSYIPGMVGLFAAALYSASLSTLSASYSALSAVFIEDVIKQYWLKVQKRVEVDTSFVLFLTKALPIMFCFLTVIFAYLCSLLQTMMLQISLSIFGIAGGPVLSVFVLGMFFPRVGGKAAFTAQITSTIVCFFIAAGAIVAKVRPVVLPLNRSCNQQNITFQYEYNPTHGMVEPLNGDSWITEIFRLSYQYYSVTAVVVAIAVAYIVQFLIVNESHEVTQLNLLSPFVRPSISIKGICEKNLVPKVEEREMLSVDAEDNNIQ